MGKHTNKAETATNDAVIKRLKDAGIDPDKITAEATDSTGEKVELTLASVIKSLISEPTDNCDNETSDCETCECSELCKAIAALRAAQFDDGQIANILGLEPDDEDDEPSCDCACDLDTYYVPIKWINIGFAKVKAASFKDACNIVDKQCVITDNYPEAKPIPNSLRADRNPVTAKMAEFIGVPAITLRENE